MIMGQKFCLKGVRFALALSEGSMVDSKTINFANVGRPVSILTLSSLSLSEFSSKSLALILSFNASFSLLSAWFSLCNSATYCLHFSLPQ